MIGVKPLGRLCRAAMPPTDLKRVAELLTVPASQGDAQAQYLLDLMRADGVGVTGVPKPSERTAERLAAEAARGDAQAQCLLGILYAEGNGVPRNLRRAAELWTAAAAQGDSNAQFNLGAMYMHADGDGVSKDPKRAAELWAAAAELGNAHAQLNLGQMCADGDYVPKDLKRATELWTAAAAQGHPFASARAEAALRRLRETAEQAAAALLREEAHVKHTAAKQAARKAARRREAKKRTQSSDSKSLLSNHCEESSEVVEAPVQPSGEGDSEPSDFVDLSDVGLARLAMDDDAATSVATSLQCVVCMSNERAVACVPCGHKCLCEGCSKTEAVGNKCPMCRREVFLFMRIFE